MIYYYTQCIVVIKHCSNGNDHAREIADMSLTFMRNLGDFRIQHMPDERVNLRIGLHTGMY